MLAKLSVLIVSLGVAAGILLHMRQARLQAVHELARAQVRMHERDRDLYRIRAAIAERITPERVEQLARQFGPLTPMGVDPAPERPETGEGEVGPPAPVREREGGGTPKKKAKPAGMARHALTGLGVPVEEH